MPAKATGHQQAIKACLNLNRRSNPATQKENLKALLELVPPSAQDELGQRVDVPLDEALDPETGQMFLLCEYNRDNTRHRSPWTNKYLPAPASASSASALFYPSDRLRQAEIEANALFSIYRELYYEGGTSSVYLWELGEDNPDGFAGCFAIKKAVADTRALRQAVWDSMHVVEVDLGFMAAGTGTAASGGTAPPTPRMGMTSMSTPRGSTGGASVTATYKLTSTVTLAVNIENADVGEASLSGTITRKTEAAHPVGTGGHMANIGRMIEDTEIALRGDLDSLYIQRTRDIVNSVRKPPTSQPPGSRPSAGEGSSTSPHSSSNSSSAGAHSAPGGSGGSDKPSPPRPAISDDHKTSLFAAISLRASQRGKDADVITEG